MQGGPAANPIAYIESQFDYYMPSVRYKELSDAEFAQKYANLLYMREQEVKEAIQLAGIGAARKRRR